MKFELTHSDDLTVEHFRAHPVWVQYYSADELDHIEAEGYDRAEVEKTLAAVDWSDDYWFKSFPAQEVTPYFFTRYYTQFELPGNLHLEGYTEFTEYSGIQNYGIWVEDQFYGFNLNVPEFNEEEEDALKERLKLEVLYPIRVRCDAGIEVEEVFDPGGVGES